MVKCASTANKVRGKIKMSTIIASIQYSTLKGREGRKLQRRKKQQKKETIENKTN